MPYHDDFFIPGITPSLANSRKQILQSPKSRIKALFLEQRKQRRTIRVENFGFLFALAVVEVFAIYLSIFYFLCQKNNRLVHRYQFSAHAPNFDEQNLCG